jgi:hypothetical protein
MKSTQRTMALALGALAAVTVLAGACGGGIALAEEETAASHPAASEKAAPEAGDLANKVQNPVSDLISVPFQENLDYEVAILFPK